MNSATAKQETLVTGSDDKIILKDIYKSFGDKKVLQGVNITAKAGKSLVIIGGSGTGKSVMIKCIQGLVTPDKGSILVDGKETCRISSRERSKVMEKFGMLFQGAALFDSLRVWENVAFGLVQGRRMNKKRSPRYRYHQASGCGPAPGSGQSIPGGAFRRYAKTCGSGTCRCHRAGSYLL